MKEKLFDYLAKKEGYSIVDGNSLLRADNSLVARLEDNKWVTTPTQQEMIDYGIQSGRGLPSLLCYKGDPTNPGAQ